MPTIVSYKWTLINNLKISDNQLEELLFKLKSEVKPIDADHVEIEVNNDRPDLFFPYGIIRAAKGILGKELGEPKYDIKQSVYSFEVKEVKSRPYAVAGIVKDIKLDDESLRELIQFQEKLHITVGRKRKKVAIGIHDLDKITSTKIYYKPLPLDYKFIPLNQSKLMTIKEVIEQTPQGREYGNISIYDGLSPAIVEENGDVLSIPPIINSDKTRIDEKTRNIFIDVTGTSFEAVSSTLDILVTDLAEMGGKIELLNFISPSKFEFSPLLRRYTVSVSANYISKNLGINLSLNEIEKYLRMARFDTKVLNDVVEVTVPPYRVDILSQIDLVEEIAMTIGYDKLSPKDYTIKATGKLSAETELIRTLRDLSIGAGFSEIFTFILSNDKRLRNEYVSIVNPVTVEYNAVRNSLIPTLLNFLKYNQHAIMPVYVFEIGDVVIKDKRTDTGYKNSLRAVYGIMNSKVNYEDLQSRVHQILMSLDIEPTYKTYLDDMFIPGRGAKIIDTSKSVEIGVIGEINPVLLEELEIEFPVVISEIYLDSLVKR